MGGPIEISGARSLDQANSTLFSRAAPAIFVVIWATGFIVARLVAPHAEPFTFLVARYALSIAALTAIATVLREAWPRTLRGWFDALVAGVLLQGLYLGGVFWSVRHGLGAGVVALIMSLQPVVTAALAGPLLGETVTRRRWVGIGLGLLGVVFVIIPNLNVAGGGLTITVALASMLCITLGTIWQKRTGSPAHLVTGAVIQFIAALIVTLPAAVMLETGFIDNSWQLWAGLIWAVFGMSVGAILILLVLIRRGAVAQVASLFFLVPPVAALMAFALFGETLTAMQIIGAAVAIGGVAIASRA
ncbi:DMT family transporter [Chelatococcus asaccharovorans]|uniref:EamA-like transporter family protein n=1 Tax=Chelatococcus asaccharovorans TaxID=28210 RepID=A0A2V3ULD3_9HYPH|nr:DMT family transporter [Chelatococcus asaccharovorans]MBS7705355.1 DMT family transporter [Chelatococcus asaccharovorans]PXW60242.1 EamA-like transporter family protein [Chelatococcus asaccharovorans]